MQKLNWLHPNFLTRIDHYLKINYPHIWRTRVHDFAWFSLIVGNAVAAILALLMVGYDNVLSRANVATMHFSLAALLGFVGLFWAIRLLRFKIKFSNFKMMLTTWVIYVLCVASLGLNLATFTSTVAYRTAYLYPDKTVQADYDYMREGFSHSKGYLYSSYVDDGCHGCLKDEHRTEELLAVMSRHGHYYGSADKIHRRDIEAVESRIGVLKEAKAFVWQPILGQDFDNYEKRSFYHEILQMNWGMGMVLLFFLPTLLFLVSVFGVRNVLISAFSTALIAGLSLIVMEMIVGLNGYYTEERMLTVYAFIAFILGVTLLIGRQKLQSWNYIAGVFMLVLGIVFFTSFIFIADYYAASDNVIPIIAGVLPVSLVASLITAWMIAKRNDQPVLR